MRKMEKELDEAHDIGVHALNDRNKLNDFIANESNPNGRHYPLADFAFESTPIGDLPDPQYIPIQREVEFVNPITKETTRGTMIGEQKSPD